MSMNIRDKLNIEDIKIITGMNIKDHALEIILDKRITMLMVIEIIVQVPIVISISKEETTIINIIGVNQKIDILKIEGMRKWVLKIKANLGNIVKARILLILVVAGVPVVVVVVWVQLQKVMVMRVILNIKLGLQLANIG
jgi:hypothetical protein